MHIPHRNVGTVHISYTYHAMCDQMCRVRLLLLQCLIADTWYNVHYTYTTLYHQPTQSVPTEHNKQHQICEWHLMDVYTRDKYKLLKCYETACFWDNLDVWCEQIKCKQYWQLLWVIGVHASKLDYFGQITWSVYCVEFINQQYYIIFRVFQL